MKDSACDIVPKFYRDVVHQGESKRFAFLVFFFFSDAKRTDGSSSFSDLFDLGFIEMEDLLHGFTDPNVMDIKMGTRTFLESEVTNTTARSDLYQKVYAIRALDRINTHIVLLNLGNFLFLLLLHPQMVKVEPNAPTAEEYELQAVTKLRYMMFREHQSTSCSLGFRIEAIKVSKTNVNSLS